MAVVRDDPAEIGAGLDFLTGMCDLVLTSGGLGPTHDDMTLTAIATKYSLNLIEDPTALEIVRRQYLHFYEQGVVDSPDMFPARKKMATIPYGAIPLDNRVGGAPGIRLELDGTVIICLPGVPSELKHIFEQEVVPWIRSNLAGTYYEEVVEFKIHDESVFAPFIDEVMKKHPGVYIKSMPKRYGTTNVLRVWVSARGDDFEQLKKLVQSAIHDLAHVSGVDVVDHQS